MKYRKKPVVIEAFQMTRHRREDNSEWPEWLHAAWNKEPGTKGSLYPTPRADDRSLSIATPEGTLLVEWDAQIIKGVRGEIYPCDPGIFEATYEPVSADEVLPESTGGGGSYGGPGDGVGGP